MAETFAEINEKIQRGEFTLGEPVELLPSMGR